nr:MAG TPA: hypothetical protein [Caudoviricetes sp.]
MYLHISLQLSLSSKIMLLKNLKLGVYTLKHNLDKDL